MNEYITISEFIKVAHISRPTAYSMVHNGKIPAVRVGNAWRITQKDLDEYMATRVNVGNDYINISTLVQMLNISRPTAYKLARKMGAIKMGVAWFIPRENYNRYVAGEQDG